MANCTDSYLKWLVTHEQVLAKRNRWASRDAKFILDRRAKEEEGRLVAASKIARLEKLAAEGDFLAQMDLRMAKFIVTNRVEQKTTDISTKGNLYKPFSLMR